MSAQQNELDEKISKDKTAFTDNETNKIVYVPQGRCASYLESTQRYKIEGFYTDDFSSCCIVICLGQKKASLAHYDLQTSINDIIKQIELTSDPSCQVLMYTREAGNFVKKQLINHIKTSLPKQKIIEKGMVDEHDGISITYTPNAKSGSNFTIKEWPRNKKPLNLIHHPDEQQFLAVTKIEQFIGLKARALTKQMRKRTFLIFDGMAWEPIGKTDLVVDTSHLSTRVEMNAFKKSDPYMEISGTLGGIVQNIKLTTPDVRILDQDLKQSLLMIGVYLEGYLNNFDYELLFKRNINETLSNDFNKRLFSEKDNPFLSGLRACLVGGEVFGKVIAYIKPYENKTDKTRFQSQIIAECRIFERHYKERQYYHTLAIGYKSLKQETLALSAKAAASFKAGDFKQAANMFMEALVKLTHCCPKTDENLASVYYNLGRCIFKQGDKNPDALFFLKMSLKLRKDYLKLAPSALEKTEQAIKECEVQLHACSLSASKEAAKNSSTLTEGVPTPSTTKPTASSATIELNARLATVESKLSKEKEASVTDASTMGAKAQAPVICPALAAAGQAPLVKVSDPKEEPSVEPTVCSPSDSSR